MTRAKETKRLSPGPGSRPPETPMPAAAAEGQRTIAIPEEVARGLEVRLRNTSFASIDAFVAFVLARLLEDPGASAFTEEEERRIRDRLRSLGYID